MASKKQADTTPCGCDAHADSRKAAAVDPEIKASLRNRDSYREPGLYRPCDGFYAGGGHESFPSIEDSHRHRSFCLPCPTDGPNRPGSG